MSDEAKESIRRAHLVSDAVVDFLESRPDLQVGVPSVLLGLLQCAVSIHISTHNTMTDFQRLSIASNGGVTSTAMILLDDMGHCVESLVPIDIG